MHHHSSFFHHSLHDNVLNIQFVTISRTHSFAVILAWAHSIDASIDAVASSFFLAVSIILYPDSVYQPAVATTIMPADGQTLKQRNREKRKQRVDAAENSRNEEHRYRNRTDLDDFLVKRKSLRREDDLLRTKDFFVEFLRDSNVMLAASEDEAAEYFRQGGRPFTTALLRQFLEFAADAKQGKVPECGGKIHYDTLGRNLEELNVVTSRARNNIPREILRSAYDWLDGRLVPEGRVNIISRRKKLTLPQDVSEVLATLFSINHMATFFHTRYILYVALFLNLAVDCSGRIGELLLEGGKWCEGKCLRWRDVELYAFRLPDDTISVKASIRYAGLKGSTGTKETRSKVIPLRLLPIHLAAEDSLRQLITIGLIDDVFAVVKCWQDFQYLVPGKYGSQIQIKDTSLDLPVFRRVSRQHVLTDDGFRKSSMSLAMGRLGRRMGLTSSLLSYCLRRGAAYLLAQNCTDEERTARMGHKSGDCVYWTHYRNETSTVDFQAIRVGVDAEDVSVLSSVLLAAREGAPTTISPQGFRDAYKDPELRSLLAQEAELLDSLISQNDSLDAAKTNMPAEHQRLQTLSAKVYGRKVRVRSDIYRAEYKAYVERPCQIVRPEDEAKTLVPTTAPLLHDRGDAGSLSVASDATNAATDSSEVFDKYSSLFDNIDPTILEDDVGQNVQKFLAATNDDVDHADSSDGENWTEARRGNTGQSKVLIAPWTLADGVPAAMFGKSPLTEIELGNMMVDVFNHFHPIDYFYPGMEPLAGTLTCRYCREEINLRTGVRHARACQKKAVSEKATMILQDQVSPLQKCSWSFLNGRLCGEGPFPDEVTTAKHLARHHSRKGQPNCRLSPCDQQVPPIHFKTNISWIQHLITVHRLPGILGSAAAYVRWCSICARYLCQLDEDLDMHNTEHEELIGEIIRKEGFRGVLIGKMVVRPPLNPFEVYDVSLHPSERFHLAFTSTFDLEESMEYNLAKLDDNGIHQCPASRDAGPYITAICDNGAMSKEQLRTHLQESHGLRPFTRSQKRPKTKATEASPPPLSDNETPTSKPRRQMKATKAPLSDNETPMPKTRRQTKTTKAPISDNGLSDKEPPMPQKRRRKIVDPLQRVSVNAAVSATMNVIHKSNISTLP